MANPYDLMATPDYWGGMLPQQGDYDVWNDYLAAVQAAYDAQNIPAYAGATDGAAGLSPQSPNYGRTAGDIGADALTRAYMGRYQQGASKGSPLAFESRMAMHPEEARAAYNSFQLNEQGLPEPDLPDFILAAMEALGYRSGTPGAEGLFRGGETGAPGLFRGGEGGSGPQQTPGVPDPTRLAAGGPPGGTVGPSPLADQGNYDPRQPHIFGQNQPRRYPPELIQAIQQMKAGPMLKTVAPPRPTQ